MWVLRAARWRRNKWKPGASLQKVTGEEQRGAGDGTCATTQGPAPPEEKKNGKPICSKGKRGILFLKTSGRIPRARSLCPNCSYARREGLEEEEKE